MRPWRCDQSCCRPSCVALVPSLVDVLTGSWDASLSFNQVCACFAVPSAMMVPVSWWFVTEPTDGPARRRLAGSPRKHARTHTRTHARTHARTRTHAHRHTRMHVHTHTHTHTHARTRTRTHARTHAQTHRHALTYSHTRTRMHARARTHARTRVCAHAYGRAQVVRRVLGVDLDAAQIERDDRRRRIPGAAPAPTGRARLPASSARAQACVRICSCPRALGHLRPWAALGAASACCVRAQARAHRQLCCIRTQFCHPMASGSTRVLNDANKGTK
jgi:hypothetical protein